MGSALLNPAPELGFAETAETIASAQSAPDVRGARAEHATALPATVDELRRQVAERLAAHRSRRGGAQARQNIAEPVRPAGTRSARIAAAVAERYAQTPSYRDLLEAEAERATQQARAAAEVAAINAQAVAAAQQRLLAAYDEHRDSVIEPEAAVRADEAVAMQLWQEIEPDAAREPELEETARRTVKLADSAVRPVQPTATSGELKPQGGLTVRLYEETTLAARASEIGRQTRYRRASTVADDTAAEAMALDEEIAFRQAPVFEEPAGPPVALAANLIEFPRQLVAARKARPRYAEGPLREDPSGSAGDGQLRIFEVDPAQIADSPIDVTAETAQWTSIWLDAPTQAMHANAPEPVDEVGSAALEPATFARRGMAAAINVAVVAAATAAFAAAALAVMAERSGIPLHSGLRQIAVQMDLQAKSAGIIVAVSAVVLLLLYQALFYVLSTATPGMRWTRIAFCTFADENPSRRAVRRRMLVTLLSAVPLGMGYAWAAIDEDRLTWHDRISRMYLRSY